jgi:hypothetical protein
MLGLFGAKVAERQIPQTDNCQFPANRTKITKGLKIFMMSGVCFLPEIFSDICLSNL